MEDARRVMEDALALDDAGVFALVLEGVPALLAQAITRRVNVPTIGIGAGPDTDGQVLVMHDMLGLNFGHYPKFVRRYAELSREAIAAIDRWIQDGRRGSVPSEEESYHMIDAAALELIKEPSGTDRAIGH